MSIEITESTEVAAEPEIARHCMVYEYGLLPPHAGGELVDQQMRKAHRYANTLTEIERERREKARAILAAHADLEPLVTELNRLRTEREEVKTQIKAQRGAKRGRVDNPEHGQLRDRSRALGQVIGELAARIKEVRTAVAADPTIAPRLAECDADAAARRRKARSECGVYWGTYLLIEASADQARKSKTPPEYKRSLVDRDLEQLRGRELWLGDGRIGVQLQGGIAPSDLTDDTQLQVLIADDHRTGRRAGTRRILRMRIGSHPASRTPIWAEWRMTMHRPIPPNAKIKWATVTKRRMSRWRDEWRVQIQVEVPAPARRTGEAVALNLGWCKVEGGIRAGFVRGEDGATEEIIVPTSIIDRIEKAASIRSIRDKNLNEMKAVLLPQLHELASRVPLFPEVVQAPGGGEHGLPEWFRQRCVLDRDGRECWHVSQWGSADRYARLAQVWRNRRFSGDEDAYNTLETWRYRDHHLEAYEAGLETGARRHRREIYRLIGAKLAQRYATLVIDDTDLRQMQRSPGADSERVEFSAVKRQQQIAAPYELRLSMLSAFRGRGGRAVVLPAAHITAKCNACSTVDSWDRAAAGRLHKCSGCGTTWDQDDNACTNLLRAYALVEAAQDVERVTKVGKTKPSRTDRFRDARARKTAEAMAEGTTPTPSA